MSEKKVMVGCRVPIALKDEIDSTARSMDCTPSQVIQIAIEQYLGIESADLPTSRMTTIEQQIRELRTIVKELQKSTTEIPVVRDFRVSSEKAVNLLPDPVPVVVSEKVLLNSEQNPYSRRDTVAEQPVIFAGQKTEPEILTEAELLDRFNLSQNWRSELAIVRSARLGA
ncbi:MAG: hypothetical protein MUC48_22135 [Leptolyngbya sp. Prado105]|nr:hypothetical protein [Leptolyngbya sp. Prado105]